MPTPLVRDVPAENGAFVVNSGDKLRRWRKDRFLSRPHQVLNVYGRDRHSVPFFVAPEYDIVQIHSDGLGFPVRWAWLIEKI